MKDAEGWSLLNHLQSGLHMLLMGVPHHRCVLYHWTHETFVTMCLDSGWAYPQVPVCKGIHFVGFCSS